MPEGCGTNTCEESSSEPKSARISDGERTSDCLPIVLGVPIFHEEMSIVSELARWKCWVACLNGYIAEVESFLDSNVCYDDIRTGLEETVNELYTIEEKLIGLSMITNSLQTKNERGSLDVSGLSIILVRKWSVLVRKWATLKTFDDWIECQCSGKRMRSEFLIAANDIINAFANMKSAQTRPISANSNSSGRSHNPSRIERWERLNDVQTKNESTPCSSSSWDQARCVFSISRYEQEQKDIGTERAHFLEEYLVYVSKCFAEKGNEAQRIHLIAPILFCVGSLFDDVQILIEKELKGVFIKAHGSFEFVIKRGNKIIGILEAKKENIDQGMAQDLIGCEIAAEENGLDIVYGIVTNYVEWVVVRYTNEAIFEDRLSIYTTCHGPEMESLKTVTGEIFAILSNDD